MKTTLVIDDQVMKRLKQQAVEENRPMSELVEAALRLFLNRKPKRLELSPLPKFGGRGAAVDIADREALYDLMEDR